MIDKRYHRKPATHGRKANDDAAEERFRAVVEASPNAILLVNEEGCVTLVNTQTEELFGYSRDELIGKPVELLVPSTYRSVL